MIAAAVGFASLILIWFSVIWGLVLRNGWLSTRFRHSSIHGMHMIPALIGLTLGVVHAFAQLAVPFGVVQLVDLVMPFTNPTDPIGIGIGVVSLQIMLAAAFSVIIQRWMGYNRWRALHSLNHVAFMLLVGHVLISGTDVTPTPVWGAVAVGWLFTMALWASTAKRAFEVRRAVGERLGVTTRRNEVIVGVDSAKCARFGFCEHEAPDVFTLLSDGRLSYRVSVPADEADDVLRAIDGCPRRAISLNRVPTAVVSGVRSEEESHLTSPRGLRTAKITEMHNRGAQQ